MLTPCDNFSFSPKFSLATQNVSFLPAACQVLQDIALQNLALPSSGAELTFKLITSLQQEFCIKDAEIASLAQSFQDDDLLLQEKIMQWNKRLQEVEEQLKVLEEGVFLDKIKQLRKDLFWISNHSREPLEGEGLCLQELRQEVALLQYVLRQSVVTGPPLRCPLSVLGEWCQEIEEQCFAVKEIEERIATLMQCMQRTSDPALDAFGNKHKNLVLQADFADVLQIGGIEVPRPQGVSSTQVHQF